MLRATSNNIVPGERDPATLNMTLQPGEPPSFSPSFRKNNKKNSASLTKLLTKSLLVSNSKLQHKTWSCFLGRRKPGKVDTEEEITLETCSQLSQSQDTPRHTRTITLAKCPGLSLLLSLPLSLPKLVIRTYAHTTTFQYLSKIRHTCEKLRRRRDADRGRMSKSQCTMHALNNNAPGESPSA